MENHIYSTYPPLPQYYAPAPPPRYETIPNPNYVQGQVQQCYAAAPLPPFASTSTASSASPSTAVTESSAEKFLGPTSTQPVQWYQYPNDCKNGPNFHPAHPQSAYYYYNPESYQYYPQALPNTQVQPDTKTIPFVPQIIHQDSMADAPRSASASSESSSKTSSRDHNDHDLHVNPDKLEDHPPELMHPGSYASLFSTGQYPFQSYAELMNAAYNNGPDSMPAILLTQPYPLSALTLQPQIPPVSASMMCDGCFFTNESGTSSDSESQMKIPGTQPSVAATVYPFLHSAGYIEPQIVEQSKPSTNKKKRKDPNAPKNPLSAYLFFVTEQRAALAHQSHKPSSDGEGGSPGQGSSFSAVAKQLGQRWKNMTEEERLPYVELAKKDKLRYESEKKAFSVDGKKVFI